jgi:hypothetical protein
MGGRSRHDRLSVSVLWLDRLLRAGATYAEDEAAYYYWRRPA